MNITYRGLLIIIAAATLVALFACAPAPITVIIDDEPVVCTPAKHHCPEPPQDAEPSVPEVAPVLPVKWECR